MTKNQKIWMWIFVAMFALPEILFLTTPALIMAILGKSFVEIYALVVSYKFFLSHPIYLLLIIIAEIIGTLGLLILSVKNNKKIIAFILGIVLLWLFYIFAIIYITGFSMSL